MSHNYSPQDSSSPSHQKVQDQQKPTDKIQQELKEARATIEDLKKSNELYQMVINHLPHFYTFWKDLDSKMLGCSKGMSDRAGLSSPEEMIGKSDYDMPWSDQADAFCNIDQMVMKQNIENYTVQENHTPADGKTLWLSTTKIALNNKKGEVIGLLGVSEDLTEKRKLDRLLKESEQRFRQLSEATFEGVAIHNHGKIADANPVLAQMFNYDHDELIGMDLTDLNAPEFHDLIRNNIKSGNAQPFRSIGLQRVREGESPGVRQLDIEITIRREPIPAISIRDITEQIRIEQLKDEFLANTSHELRTPLNGIIGIAESLIAGAAGSLPEQVHENLSMIVSSGRRLYGLINDILDYSKMRQHALALQLKPVDLKSIVEMVLSLSQPLVGEKQLELLNNIPDNFPSVLGDENRLQQIFYNLIGNAIKFTAEGEVTVEARQHEDKVEITVSDTGIGIPNSKQKQIFQSFEQGDSSTSREFGGSGLGLTISQQLVNLHGSNLQVANNPHKGSRFYFSLKITDRKPESTMDHKQSSTLLPLQYTKNILGISPNSATHSKVIVPQGTGQSILVIDDENVNLKVMRNFLELHHYRVLVAQSAFQALDILKIEQPDLILLDIMMPRMDGHELCGRIRETYDAWLLPIIFLTAKNEVSDLLRGLNGGANDYLTKPFSQEELLSRVKTHLRIKESVETLQENQQLKAEIVRRKKVEQELDRSKKRLAKILDVAEMAIIAINENQEIVYFNQRAESLFGYSAAGILGKFSDLLIAQSYQTEYRQLLDNIEQQSQIHPVFKARAKLTVRTSQGQEVMLYSSVTSFELDDERIYTFVINPDPSHPNPASPDQYERSNKDHQNEVFSTELIQELMDKKQTILSMDGFFDNILQYLIEGGPELLPQLRENLDPLLREEDHSTPYSEEMRQTLVDVMEASLNAWQEITGKNKVDLAEESNIWKVYLDQGVFKTRTLDKYLKLEKLPQKPKYNKVIDTAEFVINQCEPSNKISMHQLKELFAKLTALLEKS
ncbi:MAG: PAS domain S-box protein [SAR324 cluster bacterium]|nr:PAS domain S-box protein [SAR324 cluster bacterium]